MKTLITVANYEAFYLDELEGNLTEELSAELHSFLLEHPDLKLPIEPLLYLESTEQLSAFEKALLHSFNPSSEITLDNIPYAIIADQEGILTKKQAKQLAELVRNNPAIDTTSYPTLAPTTLVYPNKKSLQKQTTPIITLRWLSIGTIAASIALVISIFPKHTSTVQTKKPIKAIAKQIAHSFKKNTKNSNKKEMVNEITTYTVESTVSCSFPSETPVEQIHVHESPVEHQIILPVNPIENVPTVALNELQPQNNVLISQNKTAEDNNVLALVTSIIASKLNTPIAYKITKASNEEKGEIYFKIGRFEFSRKVSK